MFHTFNTNTNKQTVPAARASTTRRNGSAVRACDQCRRRKIRCDGQRPCEACRWYQKTDLCRYAEPDRNVASASESVVRKLFPQTELETLARMSRHELLELANKSLQGHIPQSHAISPPPETHVSPGSTESGGGDLETLQTMPEEESGDQRDSNTQDMMNNFSDDVNALSLSTKPPSSYLGASSIAAALKVINWLRPDFSKLMSSTLPTGQDRYSSEIQEVIAQAHHGLGPLASASHSYRHLDESVIIDAFFVHLQSDVPLLDEASFRKTYHSRQRLDSRWLALLNIVLALGSIVATTADNKTHYVYFQRSKSYLDLGALGRPHIETIQTLGLLGGHYLHYISQPNLAYSLMGTALRMAASLGLHKEFALPNDSAKTLDKSAIDLRRRVWWSLVVLDTWGSETLGRPSLGRWAAGITAKLPHASIGSNQFLVVLPLIENVRYCRITTRIHEAMAVVPLLSYSDMENYDKQLVEWYDNVPALLKTYEPCPEFLVLSRNVMRWRCTVQRTLLHRPALLSYAMRRIPYVALRAEERTAVDKCLTLSYDAIQDIVASTVNCSTQMCGWRGVWFLFQALMVPLLALFIEDPTNSVLVGPCREQIKAAIAALVRMQAWSPTAMRTLDCVCDIFDASTQVSAQTSEQVNGAETQVPLPSSIADMSTTPANFASSSLDSMEDTFGDDSMWDYITWSDDPLGQSLSLTQFHSHMFPDEQMLNFDSNYAVPYGDGSQSHYTPDS